MEEESIDIETEEYSEDVGTTDTVANDFESDLLDTSLSKFPSHQGKQKKNEDKLLKLPFSRVKTLIKLDPDVSLANQEAVFLIAKAAEFFVEKLAKEACTYTLSAKKKTIQKPDVLKCLDSVEALSFLEGIID